MSAPAVAVRERPILFSGPMVRAILAHRKAQTRRVILPQPTSPAILDDVSARAEVFLGAPLSDRRPFCSWMTDERREDGSFVEHGVRCPYGATGDRLWVREAHAILDMRSDVTDFADAREPRGEWPASVTYTADDATLWFPNVDARDWRIGFDNDHVITRPSIHMPRWASRLTLELTGVRVERVQEISEADAIAEGVDACCVRHVHFDGGACRCEYQHVWDALNDKRGFGWFTNPWVWVLDFAKVAA